MHTGYQCKVNELEYGDLLLETCLVVDGETEIHRRDTNIQGTK